MKKLIIIISCICILILVVLLLWNTYRTRNNTNVLLTVPDALQGAKLFVDGVEISTWTFPSPCNLRFTTTHGYRKIVLKKEGYKPVTKEFEIQGHEAYLFIKANELKKSQ